MHFLLLVCLLLSPTLAAAGTPIVGFDQDFYSLAAVNVNGSVTSNQYVRAHETIDHWQRMLTFKEYAGTQNIKDVLSAYMESVKPLLAQKAKVFEKEDSQHAEEIIAILILSAPDKSHYEYVIHRLVADAKHPVRSMIFSQRMPHLEPIDSTEIDKKQNQWMMGLENVNPELYKTLPADAGKRSPSKQKN